MASQQISRRRHVGGLYEDVVPAGIVLALHIIAKNYLRAWVIRVAPIAQELCNVLDILVASMKFIPAAGVIDANEEGLLARHD
jgi:hypothetical protein